MILPDKAAFKRSLLAWYSKHARPLPWRASHDPYRIWISEIMLQQTTVAAVIPYFERFLTTFPDVASLAASDEQDVLRLWEGLGYYSRARNLRKAAQAIMTQYEGDFPQNVDALQSLPGIGRYTAGAIASFAFNLSAPIVEANTQRLYARLAGYEHDLKTSASQKFLWQFAEAIVPTKDAGLFNQAVMELGSRICRPVEPSCETCPVSKHCEAFKQGKQASIPVLPARQKATEIAQAYVVIEHNGNVLMQQYAPSQRWAGLWDFVRIDLDEESSLRLKSIKTATRRPGLFPLEPLTESEIASIESQLQEQTGLPCRLSKTLAISRQSVTRYRITLVCLEANIDSRKHSPSDQYTWKTWEQITHLPLSVMGRELLTICQTRS
ncbi:A/G-specific adenine glycosylase [Lacunimicrobium album]